MVSIIDDREDVWSFSPNLIHVKPYRFFQGTADINAPSGLTKTEQDQEPMVHRVRRISQSSTNSTDSAENDRNEKSKFPTEEEMKKAEKEKAKHTIEMEVDEETNEKNSDNDKDKENTNDTEKIDNEKENDKDKENTNDTEKTDVEKEKENKSDIDRDKTNTVDSEKKDIAKESDDVKENKKNEKDLETESNKEESVTEVKDDDVSGKGDGNKKSENNEKKECSTKKEESTKDGDKSGDTEKDVKCADGETKEDDEVIVWEDEDDYLFYLREILENIHKTFYDMDDQLKKKEQPPSEKDKPNLKNIIPYMKKKVLRGCNIVFSGVIPTNMAQEKSRAYIVATALGANVQKDLMTKDNENDPSRWTTHIVAARLGTSKVRTALKYKHVSVVNVDWLWSCSERWEKVEEGLFPLTKASDDRNCDSPSVSEMAKKKDGKRKLDSNDYGDRNEKRPKIDEKGKNKDSSKQDTKDKSGKGEEEGFSHSYNPLFAFSDDDLAYMDKEVDDEMKSDDDSSEDEADRETRLRDEVLKDLATDSSSEDSLSGNMPRGWGLKNKLSPKSSSSDDEAKSPHNDTLGPEYESETDQDKFEKIMDAFGPVTDNSDEEYQESIGSVDDELADAVEKEFLS